MHLHLHTLANERSSVISSIQIINVQQKNFVDYGNSAGPMRVEVFITESKVQSTHTESWSSLRSSVRRKTWIFDVF